MTAAQFTIELDTSDLKWIIEHILALDGQQIRAVCEPYLLSSDIEEADDGLPELIKRAVLRAWSAGPPGAKLGPGKLPELRAAIEQLLPEDGA